MTTSTLCSSILPLTPYPPGISILGGDCHTPSHHPLEFQKLSYLVETKLEGIFQTKVLLQYTIMRKIIVYAIKQQRKKHFIHVSEVSNNLNFQLRVVTKNINMEAMTLAYLHILSHKT